MIDRRLSEVMDAGTTTLSDRGYGRTMVAALKKMGGMAPRPVAEMGKLRLRLITAGFRGSEALIVFLGVRVGVALAAFVLC